MNNYIEIINKNKLILYNKNKKEIIENTFNDYINRILSKDLTTINGRLDAVKNKYGYKKLTPLFIDDYLCFIPIEKIKENIIYINVFNVVEVNENKIVFLDGQNLKIYKNSKSILNNIKRAKQIKKLK